MLKTQNLDVIFLLSHSQHHPLYISQALISVTNVGAFLFVTFGTVKRYVYHWMLFMVLVLLLLYVMVYPLVWKVK